MQLKILFVTADAYKQGLDAGCLQVVLQSIVISKVLYALAAWGGYVSRENISRIDKNVAKSETIWFY